MGLLIKNINWEKLKEEILQQKSFLDKNGYEYKEILLGKTSDLTPSGKHRDFGRPARNLEFQGGYKGYMVFGGLDAQQDSDWWKELIEEGKKHGIYIRPSDKSRKFIMAGIITRENK